jgi:hypothetical protein
LDGVGHRVENERSATMLLTVNDDRNERA